MFAGMLQVSCNFEAHLQEVLQTKCGFGVYLQANCKQHAIFWICLQLNRKCGAKKEAIKIGAGASCGVCVGCLARHCGLVARQ